MELFEFLKNISNEVYVFIVSLFPIIELRGAIPLGAAMGMDIFENYFLSVFGNLLPIPLILVFIKKFIEWMSRSRFKLFNKIAKWLITKAENRSDKVDKYSLWGLFLFVAIPLPGTGGWTGALIAALMNMRFKKAFLSIAGGIAVAGVIMSLASYGVVSFLKIFA